MRVEFFSRWLEMEKPRDPKNVEANQMHPQPRAYWLPAFFFPQGKSKAAD